MIDLVAISNASAPVRSVFLGRQIAELRKEIVSVYRDLAAADLEAAEMALRAARSGVDYRTDIKFVISHIRSAFFKIKKLLEKEVPHMLFFKKKSLQRVDRADAALFCVECSFLIISFYEEIEESHPIDDWVSQARPMLHEVENGLVAYCYAHMAFEAFEHTRLKRRFGFESSHFAWDEDPNSPGELEGYWVTTHEGIRYSKKLCSDLRKLLNSLRPADE